MPVQIPTSPSATRGGFFPIDLFDVEHLVLEDVSWSNYERMLKEIGDGPIRVTYDDGRLEIMSPLAEHEDAKKTINRFIELLAIETATPFVSYGSTTFRKRADRKGLEPDDCYYFKNLKKMAGRKRINLTVDPAPDLVLEIDITTRSVKREPIYAAFGVPEIWLWKESRLQCLTLQKGRYAAATNSLIYPFLKPADLTDQVLAAEKTNNLVAAQKFLKWVRGNGWSAEAPRS